MEFHPKASDNRKNVTCRAENTNIKGSAIEDTIPLDVHCKCLFNDFFGLGKYVKKSNCDVQYKILVIECTDKYM